MGGLNGDLYVEVMVILYLVFSCEGDDLFVMFEVLMMDVIFGIEIFI